MITNFLGGLQTQLHTTLAKPETARVLHNAYICDGTLVSLPKPTITNTTNFRYNHHFKYFDCVVGSDNDNESYVEYHNELYVNRGGRLQVYTDCVNVDEVNLSNPSNKLTIDYPMSNGFILENNDNILKLPNTIQPRLRDDRILNNGGKLGIRYSKGNVAVGNNIQLNLTELSDNIDITCTTNVFNYTDSKLLHTDKVVINTSSKFVTLAKFDLIFDTLSEIYLEINLSSSSNVSKVTGQWLIGYGTVTERAETDYVYTYLDLKGNESGASEVTTLESFNTFNQAIKLSGFIPKANHSINVYRKYLGEYLLIANLNDEVYFIDTLPDLVVSSFDTLLYFGTVTPPDQIDYITMYDNRLFAITKNRLYFSEVGRFKIWKSTSYIEFDYVLRGIGKSKSGLLIFSKDTTYRLVGDNLLNFTVSLVSSNLGCINKNSIQNIGDSLIWLSNDGFVMDNYSPNGFNLVKISDTVLGFVKYGEYNKRYIGNYLLDKFNYSCVVGGKYYITYGYETALVIDFRLDKVFYTIDTNCVKLINRDGLLQGTNVGKKLVDFYLDNDLSNFEFVSQKITLDISKYKSYKDIVLTYNGSIKVTIYIDDNIVLDKQLEATYITTEVLKLAHSSKGYYIQFKLLGKGRVFKISKGS